MQVTLDIEFDNEIKDDYTVVENVTNALLQAMEDGNGISPDNAMTKSILVFDDNGRSLSLDAMTGKITTV